MLYHDESYKRLKGHNNLSEEISYESVRTEGYSVRDMNMYYSGTYMLKHIESRNRYTPVYIIECVLEDDGYKFLYQASSGKRYTRPCSEFISFFVPYGVYLKADTDELFLVQVQLGGYKKSLSAEKLSLKHPHPVHGPTRFSYSHEIALKYLVFCLYPEDKGIYKSVLSRRVFCEQDRVFSVHPWRQIAQYNSKTNTIRTPCPALLDRLVENKESVKCQLMQ